VPTSVINGGARHARSRPCSRGTSAERWSEEASGIGSGWWGRVGGGACRDLAMVVEERGGQTHNLLALGRWRRERGALGCFANSFFHWPSLGR
jgi:hypothetical protein